MSDHIGYTNKMVSDCPGCGAARGPYANTFLCGSKECKDGKVARSTRCEHRERDDLREKVNWLTVELNAANARIKRLEEAGDKMERLCSDLEATLDWLEAKEAKP